MTKICAKVFTNLTLNVNVHRMTNILKEYTSKAAVEGEQLSMTTPNLEVRASPVNTVKQKTREKRATHDTVRIVTASTGVSEEI